MNNHKLNFTYDSLNRLTNESQSGANVNYTYDDNNNLTSITNPENKVTAYTYDELNRVLNVGYSGSLIASYTYTGILNEVLSYENGVNILKTYDTLNRLNTLNNGIKSYNYTYDDVGNILSDSHKNYTYDQIYRLTQVNENLSGSLLESYDFDDVGNRLNDGVNEYSTNDLNQYTSLSGATSKSLVYDDNGNLKQNDKFKFFYDYKNRLVKVTNISGTGIIVEFAYDVLGRRYEKKTNSETTKYVYSNENILTEYKTSNGITTKKEYINGLGVDNLIAVEQEESDLTQAEKGELNFCNTRVLPYANEFNAYSWTGITERCNELSESGTILTTNRYYFSKNHLGNVDGITDINGNVVTSYEYDSYGNFSLSGSDIGNTRLFTSREYDEEIGLYYFRARYYDSELGRFISRDPIGQVDDVNLYGYVKNNPVMFVDLTGTNSKGVLAKTVGVLKNATYDTASFIGLNVSGAGGKGTGLDVSAYMLAKFMYGDGSSDYYGNNHWISNEVKNTDFYKEEINYIKGKVINDNIGVLRTEQLFGGDGAGSISEDFDFGTSFGTIKGTISAMKNEDGSITTTLNIKDTYIFNDNDKNGDPINNPFNKMGKHYQDRGYGTPFTWELNISENFNY